MNLRSDIQGLRAFAVLSVVLFHMQRKWLPGGFIGVDVFFVISGFLISKAILVQNDQKTFRYVDFLYGRIKRIVPAFYVMLLVVSLAGFFIFVTFDKLALLYDLRSSLVFMSNQVFASATDYFGAKMYEKALLHTWSLCIEMQFYLVLPLILIYVPKTVLKWVLVFGAAVIFCITHYQIVALSNKSAMYFSVWARSSEFVVGILLNFVPNSNQIKSNIKNILGFLALVVLVLSCFLINENSVFPGFLALPACCATALVIWLENSKINRVFEGKSLVYIGTLSYSLYLWHWPVLALFRYYCMRYDLTFSELIFAISVLILCTLFSYYCIEKPVLKSSKKRVFLILLALGLSLFMFWFLARRASNTIQNTEEMYTTPNKFDMRNHVKFEKYFLMGAKQLPDDSIAVIGDSHALVISAFFDAVGKKNRFNFSYLSTNFVPPLPGIATSVILPEYQKQYLEALPRAEHLIQKSKIIFIVKNWQGNNNYFASVFQRLVNQLKPTQSLVLVSDFPGLQTNPVRKFKSIVQPKNFKPQQIHFPAIPNDVLTIIQNHKNCYWLELKNESFFKSAPFFKDTLMYYDENHLNYFGSSNYATFEGYKLADLIAKIKSNNNSN